MKKILLAMVSVIALTAANVQLAIAADDAKVDNAAIVAESSAILERDPKNLEARSKRADASVNLHDYTSALADFDLLVIQDPVAFTFFKRGNAFMRRGDVEGNPRDYDAGIEDFSKSIELDGGNAYAFYFRGTMKIKRGKVDAGIADIGEAIKRNNGNVWFYHSRGEAHFNNGDYKSAVSDWQQARKLGFDKSLEVRISEAKAKM